MGACRRSGFGARIARLGLAGAVCLAVANCTVADKFARKIDPKYGVAASPRVVEYGDPVPKGGGTYRIGKPYVVAGQTYVPEDDKNYVAEGLASWYGDDFHGRRTANGEVFDMDSLSAAHPTLPMPSYVRVTNLRNHRSLIVRVNDRGPYHRNRVIDVSRRAAHLLGFRGNGVARVRVEYVGRASLDGSDDRLLMATLREGEPAPVPSMVRVASARSFVPQARAISPVASGRAPLPQGRPYDLGEPDQGPASHPAHQSTVAARFPQEPSRALAQASRTLDQQAHALDDSRLSPTTAAYAPVRYEAPMSGRGLY